MRRIRLLLVDDDAITRRLVSQYLAQEAQMELVAVSTSLEGLEHLHQGNRFDGLILDWSLPDMNGYQLLCALRANPRFSGLRILMLTIKNSLDDVQQAMSAGADEYLMKPFNQEMLLSKLALLQLG